MHSLGLVLLSELEAEQCFWCGLPFRHVKPGQSTAFGFAARSVEHMHGYHGLATVPAHRGCNNARGLERWTPYCDWPAPIPVHQLRTMHAVALELGLTHEVPKWKPKRSEKRGPREIPSVKGSPRRVPRPGEWAKWRDAWRAQNRGWIE